MSARVEGASRSSTYVEGVASFYECHPYPPPIDDLSAYEAWWDEDRRRADAHLFWPGQSFRDNRKILIAGCGTSQAAKYALRWPNASVTGIDFSAAALQHHEMLKRKHDIGNLELRQISVEQAAELGQSFDYIVSTGVLHHLPDPDAGLWALREVLAPDGAMHLMLYAPYGRTGLYMLQDYCRRLGIGTSQAEIGDLAAVLSTLPPHHPLRPLLGNRDFQDEAGLADALLHPQDRAYSVPEVFEFLASANLEFGRWVRQASYLPHCGLLVQSPHRAKLCQLPPREQYAALELLRGAMVEHSLIAYRDGRADQQCMNFGDEAWLSHVPIRVPGTIVVEDRLPPLAVAVLINPSHTFTDMYLPIDAAQKELFDAIDGKRSIGEIAPNCERREIASILFERLWHYDQIVFDTSSTGEGRPRHFRDLKRTETARPTNCDSADAGAARSLAVTSGLGTIS